MYGGGYQLQWLAAEGLYDKSKEWAESKADGALSSSIRKLNSKPE